MGLSKGTMLANRYRIDNLLATGGMGAIYRGFDTNLSIPVAIKENFFQTPQNIRQFQQEAHILAGLRHPNLPRVIHHFSHNNQQYLVMDFIAGQDLWQMVKQQGRPLEEKLALDYMLQVCDAVSYLHRQQPPIIHRDIKPQNIKVTPDGQAVLVDFGIAKIAETGSQTSTGAKGVTPGFSPPEQYSGEGTSPASDVYSLGATFYAVLTGKKPPSSISLLVKQAKFKSPSDLNAKLSPQISRAILHAMQPQIGDRPQSVAAWRRELDAIFELPTTPLEPKAETTFVGKSPAGWLVDSTGHSHQLKVGSQTLGRASSCDIQIQDRRVSRLNTTLKFDGHIYTVFDEGSANGTFVNDQPVGSRGAPLAQGGRLRIGDTEFILSATAGQPGSRPFQPGQSRTVDELAGTAYAPIPEVQPSSKSVAPPPAPASSSGAAVWVWLSVGLIFVFLVVMGLVGLFWWQRNVDNQAVDPQAMIDAAVAATEQARKGATSAFNAEATFIALAATATAQASIGTAPAVNTEATISAAISATNQAKVAETVAAQQTATAERTPTSAVADTLATPTAAEPSPTATSTLLPSPTSTPTLRPTATPVLAAPLGNFQDFEVNSTWKRGDEPNGEFSRSSARAQSGSFAGQLNYNFPTPANDYVVFQQSRALAGQPNAITAWVYGDGAGHFLNVWIKDAAGQTWQMSFGQVTHTGWRQMTAPIAADQSWPSGHISGPDNGAIDYPISFQALVLDDGVDTFTGQGTIYLDDLTSQEGAAVTPAATSTPVRLATTTPPTPASSGNYLLTVGKHLYEPWGAPMSGGDICQSYRDGNFNDEVVMKGFNLELKLTNNSTLPVADDWAPEFTTAQGREVQVCFYGYAGSGPRPDSTASMTFFTIVSPDDYVRVVTLEVNGEVIQICLDQSEAQGPC